VGIALLIHEEVGLQALKDEKYGEPTMESVRWIDLLRWSRMEDNYTNVMTPVNASIADRLHAAILQQ
jgi:hypothetical protein